MRSLFSKFFEGEFVIDEKPAKLLDRPGDQEKPDETPNAGEAGEDLLTSLSNLLIEHEKLTDLANELRARGRDSAELEPFMAKMLPFLDSFERILYLARVHPQPDEIGNWLKSVEGIYYRVTQLLETYGMVALPAIGHSVNLDYHEVVEMVEAAGRPVGVIVAERRKGYVFRGKLLRCAYVVVTRGEDS